MKTNILEKIFAQSISAWHLKPFTKKYTTMQLSELVQQIAEEFEDTPTAQITETTNLRELEEWSSMHALIIIALIDSHYDVILTGEEMTDAQTPADIYNIILQKHDNN